MLEWMFPIITQLSLVHSWCRCLEGTLAFTSNKRCRPNAAFVQSDLITLATDRWTNCEQSREQLAAAVELFCVGAVWRIERPLLIPRGHQTDTRGCLVPFRPPKHLFSDRKTALSRSGFHLLCGCRLGSYHPGRLCREQEAGAEDFLSSISPDTWSEPEKKHLISLEVSLRCCCCGGEKELVDGCHVEADLSLGCHSKLVFIQNERRWIITSLTGQFKQILQRGFLRKKERERERAVQLNLSSLKTTSWSFHSNHVKYSEAAKSLPASMNIILRPLLKITLGDISRLRWWSRIEGKDAGVWTI